MYFDLSAYSTSELSSTHINSLNTRVTCFSRYGNCEENETSKTLLHFTHYNNCDYVSVTFILISNQMFSV
ncbi:unnamed protein product, partial [Phytomonas sp. EM1]